MSDLDAVFRAVNASGTGAVTPAEVQAALALGGLTFSLQACAQLVRLHDGDRDGRVDRAEFGALHAFLDGLATACDRRRRIAIAHEAQVACVA